MLYKSIQIRVLFALRLFDFSYVECTQGSEVRRALYFESAAEHTRAHEGTLAHTLSKYSNLETRGCGGGFAQSLFLDFGKH